MNFTEKLIGQENYHSVLTAPAEKKIELKNVNSILPGKILGEAYHYEGQKKFICVTPKKEIRQRDEEIKRFSESLKAHGFNPAEKNQEIEYVFRNDDNEEIRMEFSNADKKLKFVEIKISQA